MCAQDEEELFSSDGSSLPGTPPIFAIPLQRRSVAAQAMVDLEKRGTTNCALDREHAAEVKETRIRQDQRSRGAGKAIATARPKGQAGRVRRGDVGVRPSHPGRGLELAQRRGRKRPPQVSSGSSQVTRPILLRTPGGRLLRSRLRSGRTDPEELENRLLERCPLRDRDANP